MNEQQNFWKKTYSKDYMIKNENFDDDLGIDGWKKMLKNTTEINSLLECGCNIGRNIKFLNKVLPKSKKSIIEISKKAFRTVSERYDIDKSFNGSIVDSKFKSESFDLVFSSGVFNSYSSF